MGLGQFEEPFALSIFDDRFGDIFGSAEYFASLDLALRNDYGIDQGSLTVRELADTTRRFIPQDCDVNCRMLGIVGQGLDDPVLTTIVGAQRAGLEYGALSAIAPARIARPAIRSLFGKGGLLNSNRYLRIGFSRHQGTRVFRVTGQLIGNRKLDIFKAGRL